MSYEKSRQNGLMSEVGNKVRATSGGQEIALPKLKFRYSSSVEGRLNPFDEMEAFVDSCRKIRRLSRYAL